jgi:hypothetical protein
VEVLGFASCKPAIDDRLARPANIASPPLLLGPGKISKSSSSSDNDSVLTLMGFRSELGLGALDWGLLRLGFPTCETDSEEEPSLDIDILDLLLEGEGFDLG